MSKVEFRGIICSGLGEGKRFLGMKQYKQEIEHKLGFTPFEGTLNVIINPLDMKRIKAQRSIEIDGFESEGLIFGKAHCYRATLAGRKGAIIIPEVNKHDKNVLEFISTEQLRTSPGFEDNQAVSIVLEK